MESQRDTNTTMQNSYRVKLLKEQLNFSLIGYFSEYYENKCWLQKIQNVTGGFFCLFVYRFWPLLMWKCSSLKILASITASVSVILIPLHFRHSLKTLFCLPQASISFFTPMQLLGMKDMREEWKRITWWKQIKIPLEHITLKCINPGLLQRWILGCNASVQG